MSISWFKSFWRIGRRISPIISNSKLRLQLQLQTLLANFPCMVSRLTRRKSNLSAFESHYEMLTWLKEKEKEEVHPPKILFVRLCLNCVILFCRSAEKKTDVLYLVMKFRGSTTVEKYTRCSPTTVSGFRNMWPKASFPTGMNEELSTRHRASRDVLIAWAVKCKPRNKQRGPNGEKRKHDDNDDQNGKNYFLCKLVNYKNTKKQQRQTTDVAKN